MENGEPQVDNLEISYQNESFSVTASVTATRNCADCSTELKSFTFELETDFDLDAFELSQKLCKAISKNLESGDLEAQIEEDGADINEGGGGRYQKNMIECVVNFTASIVHDGKTYTKSGTLSQEAAASEFEECC